MSSQVASHSQKPAKKPTTYSRSKTKTKPKEKSTSSQLASQGTQRQPEASTSTIANILHQTQDDISSDEENDTNVNDALVPPGHVRLTDVLDVEEFDWDAVRNNDDLELVVLRVPEGIKSRHLSHLSLSLPPAQATTSQKLGSLSRKSGTYDVWSIAHTSSSSSAPDFDESRGGPAVGGEELLGMNVLIPRKKKGGKMYLAPKPITHHLVLTGQAALPTPPATPPEKDKDSSSTTNPTRDSHTTSIPDMVMFKSPARYQHPKHLLKHRFLPTGAGLTSPASSTSLPSISPIPSASPTSTFTSLTDELGAGAIGSTAVTRPDEGKTRASEVNDEREKEKKDEDGEGKEQEKGHRRHRRDESRLEGSSGGSSPAKKRKPDGEGKKSKKVKTARTES